MQRQVLIEATIVEVKLSDQYQAGIDWQRISGNFSYIQSMIGANIADTPAYILRYTNPNSSLGNISATVKLLEQFGNAKVLSSPKIMALNNQTAILKVVDNRVFFRVNIEQTDATDNSPARTTYETEIHTVPEGVIMHITPQISQEGAVILNVRPTVSRIVDFAYDPNPTLEIPNKIPIVQVREIESILKVNSGNIAVLGGLMQDITSHDSDNVPVLSNLPVVGDLFRHRDDNFVKSELVIFLRPVVIKDASLNGDLKAYRRYLHDNRRTEPSAPTGLQLNPQNWNRYAR
ncbi:Type II secretion system protein D precursor [Candidatus Venteria ishoeyi]|uniref:Type II secretion system protein D n=1 Tax=Candidatus Venteria ishoeyi TaxID=1899563 RepID=A0A1H6F9U5_9GAMM|nr:Type II secretion system protein D precursor [Candidatus Venteria ishoeyi]